MAKFAPGWRRLTHRPQNGSEPANSGPRNRRRSGWSLAVPVIALAAGLLFTTSATSAERAPLRVDRQLELSDLIEERAEPWQAGQQAGQQPRQQAIPPARLPRLP